MGIRRAGLLLTINPSPPISWSLSWRNVGRGEVSGAWIFRVPPEQQAEVPSARKPVKGKVYELGVVGAPEQVP